MLFRRETTGWAIDNGGEDGPGPCMAQSVEDRMLSYVCVLDSELKDSLFLVTLRVVFDCSVVRSFAQCRAWC